MSDLEIISLQATMMFRLLRYFQILKHSDEARKPAFFQKDLS